MVNMLWRNIAENLIPNKKIIPVTTNKDIKELVNDRDIIRYVRMLTKHYFIVFEEHDTISKMAKELREFEKRNSKIHFEYLDEWGDNIIAREVEE